MTVPDDVTITIASTEPGVLSPTSADTLAHPCHAAQTGLDIFSEIKKLISDLGAESRADRDPLAPRGKTRARRYRGNGDMDTGGSPGQRASTRIYRQVQLLLPKELLRKCWFSADPDDDSLCLALELVRMTGLCVILGVGGQARHRDTDIHSDWSSQTNTVF